VKLLTDGDELSGLVDALTAVYEDSDLYGLDVRRSVRGGAA